LQKFPVVHRVSGAMVREVAGLPYAAVSHTARHALPVQTRLSLV
jgi:hypothetical protein